MKRMNKTWTSEIEKKYRLNDETNARRVVLAAIENGLIEKSWTLQRDLVPDFQGNLMRDKGVLLRIRTLDYLTGTGPTWILTLKIKTVKDGVHHNQELESRSDDQTNSDKINEYLYKNFGVSVDILKLVSLEPSYLEQIGLSEHRMYIEKRRREYKDDTEQIVLAVDELPAPLGWFAEIELGKRGDEASFSRWEKQLGLDEMVVLGSDYGQLVKDADRDLSRRLSF